MHILVFLPCLCSFLETVIAGLTLKWLLVGVQLNTEENVLSHEAVCVTDESRSEHCHIVVCPCDQIRFLIA